jgi:hypothetical protein
LRLEKKALQSFAVLGIAQVNETEDRIPEDLKYKMYYL